MATTLMSGCGGQRSLLPPDATGKPAPVADIDSGDESQWNENFKNFVRHESDRDVEETSKEVGHQAEALMGNKQYAQALVLLKKLLSLQIARYGPEHPRVAGTYLRLAFLADVTGDLKSQEIYLRKDLAIKQKFLGAAAPDVLYAIDCLCANLLKQGKYAEAGKMVDICSPQVEQLTAKQGIVAARLNAVTCNVYHRLGSAYDSAGQHARALQTWLKLIPLYKRQYGPYSREVAVILEDAAVDYDKEKNTTGALDARQQALSIYERKDLSSDVARVGGAIAQSYLNRGFEYDREGLHAQALQVWLQLLPVYQRLHGSDSVDVAAVFEDIGIEYDAVKDAVAAKAARQKALAIYQEHGRKADAARMRQSTRI